MKVNRHNKMYALGGMLKKFMMGGRMYEHGGQYHDADGNPTNEKGERIPSDPLVTVASDQERRAGLAGDDGSAMTGRNRGGTTEGVQETGSTIATGDQAALMNPADAAAGTIASFNTEAVSPDMSQEQFDLAMQSPFVAEQFKGQDIQNPQQLSDAYKVFKTEVTNAIRGNESSVANSAKEFAETNDNFKIKLDKLAEDLGREPTDQDIADMMVTMNTDGLFGDLHGAVVSQFLPSRQLNATALPDGPLAKSDYFVADEYSINGQNLTKGGQVYTSIQDRGINSREGMEMLFQDATDAGVDLTQGNKSTERFLRQWYENPDHADFIMSAGGAERMASGMTGRGDISQTSGKLNYLIPMIKEAQQKETDAMKQTQDDKEANRSAKRKLEGDIQKLVQNRGYGNKNTERYKRLTKEIEALQQQLNSMAMGGKFKVLKSGEAGMMEKGGRLGALAGLFTR